MNVAIATRNNLIGLSHLIGSLANEHIYLSISDGSDTPIITDPQMSRILASVGNIHYQHTTKPYLLEQRFAASDIFDESEHVLFLDDDLCLDSDCKLGAVFEALLDTDYGFIQGVKVDRFNERNYKDFDEFNVASPHHRNWPANMCTRMFVSPEEMTVPFRYDGGVMCVKKGEMDRVHAFFEYGTNDPAGVIDDAFVQRLGDELNTAICPQLQFTHLGNSNANWSAQDQKEFAVDKFNEGD